MLDRPQTQDQAIVFLILTDDQKLLPQPSNYACFFYMVDSVDACFLEGQICRRLCSNINKCVIGICAEHSAFNLGANNLGVKVIFIESGSEVLEGEGNAIHGSGDASLVGFTEELFELQPVFGLCIRDCN